MFQRLLRLHDVAAAEEVKLQQRLDAAVVAATTPAESGALTASMVMAADPEQNQDAHDSTCSGHAVRGSVVQALQFRTGAVVAPIAADAGDCQA